MPVRRIKRDTVLLRGTVWVRGGIVVTILGPHDSFLAASLVHASSGIVGETAHASGLAAVLAHGSGLTAQAANESTLAATTAHESALEGS